MPWQEIDRGRTSFVIGSRPNIGSHIFGIHSWANGPSAERRRFGLRSCSIIGGPDQSTGAEKSPDEFKSKKS
jgi:hypothetical protein